jgi:hypothetical protein
LANVHFRLGSALVASMVALSVAACGDAGVSSGDRTDFGTTGGGEGDLGVGGAPDLGAGGDVDLGGGGPVDLGGGGPADLGGPVTPPDLSNLPPPGPLSARIVASGEDVLDVSIDQGNGLWWVTSSRVSYLPAGAATPFRYDQSNGLARGQYTWVDDWFNNPGTPTTLPVTFASVGGGVSGQAVVGNIGAIADRLEVDPATGAILRLENMRVDTSSGDPEKLEQERRVVATLVVAVDLNGTWGGTAYLGGYHGISAVHGLTRNCNCMPFEQHTHYTDDRYLGGSSVKAFAFDSDGDLWTGERKMASLLLQRSRGETASLFEPFAAGVDVWPGFEDRNDDINGVAVDAAGVVSSSARATVWR